MESVESRLNRLREERIAREKARIEKLRDINLKKYNKNESQSTPAIRSAVSSASIPRPSKSDAVTKLTKNTQNVKNNFHVNGTTKRPITVPLNRKSMVIRDFKPNETDNAKVKVQTAKNGNDTVKQVNHLAVHGKKVVDNVKDNVKMEKKDTETKVGSDKVDQGNTSNAVQVKKPDAKIKPVSKNFVRDNKLTQCKLSKTLQPKQKPIENARKSMLPVHKGNQNIVQVNTHRQSVFERLYQPKAVPKKEVKDVEKIQTDTKYLRKAIMNSGLILNKRHTCFEHEKAPMPVRRSISAVHFKRINKSEINNCIHKWASIGSKLDKISLKDVNEDHSVKDNKISSAVKSEKKKVQFQTPVPFNFNTPRPEELQARLQNWLQKRGKSIDSYHHLQCFGIHHLSTKIKPLNFNDTSKLTFDDENKENIPLESDSDDDSYNDNMNEHEDEQIDKDAEDKNKWRHASVVSDSVDFNETQDYTLTSVETPHPQADKLLLGALNDLTELLREGFDWEQCARWLRAIRSRFPSAPESASYWECRAALEERRGDLPNSIHCWEEAIAKGTERSVVEANLDQLLDKFMQLKISPNGDRRAPQDHKMIDVKNIFKSTIIRFAVQQAKLRQSTGGEPPKYTCTPVRRSARLSRTRTPLQVCASVKQAALLASPVVFVPNHTLSGTP